MSETNERDLVLGLHTVLGRHIDAPVGRRLRLRLREQGKNVRDEVRQFRLLQRACRESPELAAELAEIGLEGVATWPVMPPDPRTGAAIQAFNTLVEELWEDF